MVDYICGTGWDDCHALFAYLFLGFFGLMALAVMFVGLGAR